jgi:phosphoribosylanthranilate isomerase
VKQPIVKICCIQNEQEARLALKHGATALGLVSEMPSGPGIIPIEQIRGVAEYISDSAMSVLLTSNQDANIIIEQIRFSGVNTVQIVDEVSSATYSLIRQECPAVNIIQVIHVTDKSAIEEARSLAKHVDALLLDSGNPALKIKQLGGTGRSHDWSISRKLCETVNVPVILAGGLNPENINVALSSVKPAGVDICSGVRTDGDLDEIKLQQYMLKVNHYYETK